jgi:hypothetical protein
MATQNRRGANRQQQAAPGRFDRLIDSLSRVFTLMLLVAVMYGSGMMFREVDQPVTEILVAGELTYMQQQELVDLVSTEIDGGFLTIDLDAPASGAARPSLGGSGQHSPPMARRPSVLKWLKKCPLPDGAKRVFSIAWVKS